MKKELTNSLKGIFAIPLGLSIVFFPFSMLVGWNLFTLFLFWFVLTPILTFYLSTKISKVPKQLFESIMGLSIFYGVIVFMIYDHYKTDFFQIMILSFFINLIFVISFSFVQKKVRIG